MQFTACYTKLEEDYIMGQLLEWPNVITSGRDIDDCEEMLKDAAHEMTLAYEEDGRKIPYPSITVKPIDIPVDESMIKIYPYHEDNYHAEDYDEYTLHKHEANMICKEAGIPQIF